MKRNGFSYSFRELNSQARQPLTIWREKWMQKVKVQICLPDAEVAGAMNWWEDWNSNFDKSCWKLSVDLKQGADVGALTSFMDLPLGPPLGSNGDDHRQLPSLTWWRSGKETVVKCMKGLLSGSLIPAGKDIVPTLSSSRSPASQDKVLYHWRVTCDKSEAEAYWKLKLNPNITEILCSLTHCCQTNEAQVWQVCTTARCRPSQRRSADGNPESRRKERRWH